jgi:hypothetical protein
MILYSLVVIPEGNLRLKLLLAVPFFVFPEGDPRPSAALALVEQKN